MTTRRGFLQAFAAAIGALAVPFKSPEKLPEVVAGLDVAAGESATILASPGLGLIRSIGFIDRHWDYIDVTSIHDVAPVHIKSHRPASIELELTMLYEPGCVPAPGEVLDRDWFDRHGVCGLFGDSLLDAWPTDLQFRVTEVRVEASVDKVVTAHLRLYSQVRPFPD